MRNFIIGLLLTIVGIASLMLIPSKQAAAPMPWEITVMPDNNIKVFDIHLGNTTYRQAQESLHIYGKTGIFTQDGVNPTVEAFFNSINLGGLSGKLVLNLAVSESQINDMLSRALEARLQPSGAHRYDLNNSDNEALINALVIAITYIPSVRLDEQMIRHRFGEAEAIEQDESGAALWLYPSLGLNIRLQQGEKSILLYHATNIIADTEDPG
ncbi:MAG: lytic murein transglycosylase [Methylophagaceae bacterium]